MSREILNRARHAEFGIRATVVVTPKSLRCLNHIPRWAAALTLNARHVIRLPSAVLRWPCGSLYLVVFSCSRSLLPHLLAHSNHQQANPHCCEVGVVLRVFSVGGQVHRLVIGGAMDSWVTPLPSSQRRVTKTFSTHRRMALSGRHSGAPTPSLLSVFRKRNVLTLSTPRTIRGKRPSSATPQVSGGCGSSGTGTPRVRDATPGPRASTKKRPRSSAVASLFSTPRGPSRKPVAFKRARTRAPAPGTLPSRRAVCGTQPPQLGPVRTKPVWYIDLGQKDAGFQRCGRCGMRYSPGVDDVEHAAHCRTVAAGPACVPFPRVKDAWALGTPLFVKNAPRHGKKAAGSEVEVRVVAIPAGQCRSVVQRVKAQVDADLGVCELKPGQRVFLSVTAAPRKVVGCVVTESVATAYRLRCLQPDLQANTLLDVTADSPQSAVASPTSVGAGSVEAPTQHAQVGESPDSVCVPTPEAPCLSQSSGNTGVASVYGGPDVGSLDPDTLHTSPDAVEVAGIGISQMWVHSQWRRRGIGRHQLERIARYGMYGRPLQPHQLAFSQPTRAGRALASAVSKRPDFLVYRDTV